MNKTSLWTTTSIMTPRMCIFSLILIPLIVVKVSINTIAFTALHPFHIRRFYEQRSSTTSIVKSDYVPITATNAIATEKNKNLRLVDTTSDASAKTNNNDGKVGTLLFLLPIDCTISTSRYGVKSPIGSPSIYDAAKQLCQKSNYYSNGRLDYEIIKLDEKTTNEGSKSKTFQRLCSAEIVIAMGITGDRDVAFLQQLFKARSATTAKDVRGRLCHFALDCTAGGNSNVDVNELLPAMVGPFDPKANTVSTIFPWTKAASGQRLYYQLQDLFSRYTSDDFCYGIVKFLHLFSGSEIDWVKYQTDATWEKGPIQNGIEFYNMMTQCKDCIVPCIQDEQCRECLGKMTQLDPRDQVTSYRTLVSYESDLLTNISRCIFTKKNIFQCNAQVPTMPHVDPISIYRGEPLTDEVGRAILVGHLKGEDMALQGSLQLPVSWMVACGANVAYDEFPNQHQIFYPIPRGGTGSSSKDMWYDPFFRVQTLDGRNIWCKRHYKVHSLQLPGKFRFTTFDNGVTSDEIWTLIGVAEDLSWLVVHYAGAAKTVGLQYLGGLICTPNGAMPTDPNQLQLIWSCLRNAGIQPWELTIVDNRLDTPNAIDAGLPPLGYYRDKILLSRQKQIQ